MAALTLEFGILTIDGDGFLTAHDGGGGLEGDPENDGFPIGNATLHAAGTVGRGANPAIDHAEGVVVLAAGEQRAREARADLEALGGGNREHRLGEVGFELVEDRLAEAGRAVADDTFDHPAHRVSFAADGFDMVDHRPDHRGIAGADDVGFDGVGGDGLGIDLGVEMLDGFHPSQNLDAWMEFPQHLPRHGGSGDAADGLPGGGAAATGCRADAVFRIVGVVGVAGAVFRGHLVVGAGALIGVSHENGDGRAEREAILQAGEDFRGVRLFSRGDDFGLAGPPPVELALDLLR